MALAEYCQHREWIRQSLRLGVVGIALSVVDIGAAFSSEPLEPAEALADFQLPTGYRIELVAAEPEMVDPVAIAFDEKGRLWVVEMHNYPSLAPGEAPSSRIRILEDHDGDGRFETASTFADGLLFPTGLQLWRGGVIVTLAGQIVYFPDENRDGRADRQEPWFEGFATLNEQLRANHPQLAADGWVYVAGGLRGGQIRNLRDPSADPVSINGRDFAFDPVTGHCKAVSGNGQFGLTFDDFGRRFTCSNRNPLFEVMFEQRYLDLNPKLVFPRVVHDVAAAGAASRLYPRTRALTTSAQHAGQFTAACGVEIFRGTGLPTSAVGNAFICEPTANLVHREVIFPTGAALTSAPGEKGSEFLTATDEWFRPVNLQTGPDGALYIVDMYRAVIEHPEWMPAELRNRPDMLDGIDRGRIYRVVAEGESGEPNNGRKFPTDPQKLVALLNHPNVWRRETAARLLQESGADVSASLRGLLSESDRAASVFLAISLMHRMGSVDEPTLRAALADQSAGVRVLGLTIAESRLSKSDELASLVLEMADDPDPRVRFQVALSSMMLPAKLALPALEAIALRDWGDEWTRRAVALASREEASELLAAVMSAPPNAAEDGAPGAKQMARVPLIRELIGAVVAVGDAGQLVKTLSRISILDAATATEVLMASAESLQQRGQSLEEAIASVRVQSPASASAIQQLFDDALALVSDSSGEEAGRVGAARLLRLDDRAELVAPLLDLLNDETSPPIQIAVLEALRSHRDDPRIAEWLLELFPLQLPSVRRQTLDLLVSDASSATALLTAVADKRLGSSDIDPTSRQKLLEHADPLVREATERVLGSLSKDREEVVAKYQSALELTGDPTRGKQVFAASCTSCHRIGAEGKAIGPDIGDSAMKPSTQLLTDILDPNRAIDANFVSFTAITSSGLGYQGIIQVETESGIVLLTAEGETKTILRDEIDSLTSGKSLMPEGLEQQITPQQMADLLAYLKTWRHAEDLKSKPVAAESSAEKT